MHACREDRARFQTRPGQPKRRWSAEGGGAVRSRGNPWTLVTGRLWSAGVPGIADATGLCWKRLAAVVIAGAQSAVATQARPRLPAIVVTAASTRTAHARRWLRAIVVRTLVCGTAEAVGRDRGINLVAP